MKNVYKIAIAVAVAAVFAVSAVVGFFSSSSAEKWTGEFVAKKASEALGCPVTVESIVLEDFNTVFINNIALYDKQAKKMAEAKKAEVSLRLFSALSSSPETAVSKVKVISPVAYLTVKEDGKTNIEDIEVSGEGESAFDGTIEIEDGTVYGDYAGKKAELRNVNGSLYINGSDMEFDAAAKNFDAKIVAEGELKDSVNLNIEGENIEIENYREFLAILHEKDILNKDIEIVSGKIPTVKAEINKTDKVINFKGKAEIENGRVNVYDTIIEDIAGNVAFSQDELLIDAKATANKQKAQVAGRIAFGDGSPSMDLAVKSEAFDINRVFPKVPVNGAIRVDGKITGSFSTPQIEANLYQESGEVMDVVLRNTKVQARMLGTKLLIDRASTHIFDGDVEGEGKLDVKDLAFTAHVKGNHLRAEYLANFLPDARGLYGDVSLDAAVHGKSDDLKALKIYGKVDGANLNYQNVPVERINGSFYANAGDLNIDYLSLMLADNGGSLGVEGKILGGKTVDVSVYGGKLSYAMLERLVPNFKGSGFADIAGNIKGNLSNPDVSFRLSSIKSNLFGQNYDSFRAVLAGSFERLDIDEFAMLKDGKRLWSAAGYLGIAGEKNLNLTVNTDGARLESIITLFMADAGITGNLNNTVKIAGTLDNPSVSGHFQVAPGSVKGMFVNSLTGDYTLNNDILNLDNFNLEMPLLDLTAGGTINVKTRALNLDIDASSIDMRRIEHKFPYKAEGVGSLTGKLTGTTDKPVFMAKVESEELTLNGVTISDIRGVAEFADDVLTVKDLGFDDKSGAYVLNLVANIPQNKIDGRLNIVSGDIASLMAIANNKAFPLTGALDASVVTTGTLNEPQTRLDGTIKSGTLAGYPIHDVMLRIFANPQAFNVERFSGYEGEKGEMAGSVLITPKGGISGNLSAKDISMGLIAKLAGSDANVVGSANLNASFRGDIHNPAADMTIHIANGGVLGATFDSLTGTFALDKGILNVKDLLVDKNVSDKHYQASAKGTVPIAALFKDKSVNKEDSMNLTVHLDDADLSLIPALSKEVEWGMGETDGNFTLTGTLKRPEVTGNFVVKNGSVKLKRIRKPITEMELSVMGKGREILLENLSGKIGTGSYDATGKLIFQENENAPVNFLVNLDFNKLQIESEYFTGPLSGQLTFDQSKTEQDGHLAPRISGHIDTEYAQISVPVIPESDAPMPEILLNLNLNFGKRVHLYEAQLFDMYFSGTASMQGSTRFPLPGGTIEVHRGGTVKVSNNIFNIRYGEVAFNQVGSFLPTVFFFAETHVGKTEVYVALRGPLGTNKLKTYLSSSPAMSQTEIARLLTLGSGYDKISKESSGSEEMRGILIAGLQMTALATVEKEMKKGLQLDSFAATYGSGSTFVRHREIDDYYSLSAGKYISDKWLVRYNQGLGKGSGNYLIGATYEIDDRTGIIFEHVDGANIVGVEARIRF